MRKTSLVATTGLLITVIASPTVVCSAPLFYLSDQPLGIAQPGVFSLSNPTSGTTGQLNIYAMTDVRLSGVSLDLVETGGGIRFSGLNVVNDGRWWILDGPQLIEDSKVASIGGGALPGVQGTGIGPGDSTDANFHPTSGYLLATIDYEIVDASLSSVFELQVGRNVIADWNGDSPLVHFGDYTQPAVPGTHPDLPPLTTPPPPPPKPDAPEAVQPDPAPPNSIPKFVDPPPSPEPVVPDTGYFDGPRVPIPYDWGAVVIMDDTSQWSSMWFPPELQETSKTWIAAERALVPVQFDQIYIAQFVHIPPTEFQRSQLNGLPVAESVENLLAFELAIDGTLDLSQSVPEPATIALIGLTIVAIAGPRSSRRG